MDIILNEDFRIIYYKNGVSEEEIKKLIEFSTIELPCDYISWVKEFGDAEIFISDDITIRIWGVSGSNGCMVLNIAYDIQKYISQSIAIGDDTGDNILIYTNGSSGFGLYLVGAGALGSELIFITPTLKDLLSDKKWISLFTDY